VSDPALNLSYLFGMFGVVAFGSIVPIVPTGAAVSVAAVLAESHDPLPLLLVIVVGAVGAYLGDIVTYAALHLAGQSLAERVGWLRSDAPAATLERIRYQMEQHELRTLLLSRLVPGGRIPVLLGAALGGYPFKRFAVADIGAAVLWSVVYAAIGLVGRSIFPEAWEGIVAAIVLVLVLTLAGQQWRRRVSRRANAEAATGSPSSVDS
jgi:membrane protein DedA with SNARE-associated domain